MPEHKNDNPAKNCDTMEYGLRKLHNQTDLDTEMYFTKNVHVNSVGGSTQRPVVVERTPEGIYELAGNDQEIYDLSSALPNTKVESKDFKLTNKLWFVVIILMVFGIILGVSLTLTGDKTQDTEENATGYSPFAIHIADG